MNARAAADAAGVSVCGLGRCIALSFFFTRSLTLFQLIIIRAEWQKKGLTRTVSVVGLLAELNQQERRERSDELLVIFSLAVSPLFFYT